jgi:hypothetical protein
VAHGYFGGDPAADAAPDQIEPGKFERVEHFEIVKDDVFDGVDILGLIGSATARVSRRDHARILRQALVKRHPTFGYAVDVGKAVQIQEGRTIARFVDPNVASIHVDGVPAQ